MLNDMEIEKVELSSDSDSNPDDNDDLKDYDENFDGNDGGDDDDDDEDFGGDDASQKIGNPKRSRSRSQSIESNNSKRNKNNSNYPGNKAIQDNLNALNILGSPSEVNLTCNNEFIPRSKIKVTPLVILWVDCDNLEGYAKYIVYPQVLTLPLDEKTWLRMGDRQFKKGDNKSAKTLGGDRGFSKCILGSDGLFDYVYFR